MARADHPMDSGSYDHHGPGTHRTLGRRRRFVPQNVGTVLRSGVAVRRIRDPSGRSGLSRALPFRHNGRGKPGHADSFRSYSGQPASTSELVEIRVDEIVVCRGTRPPSVRHVHTVASPRTVGESRWPLLFLPLYTFLERHGTDASPEVFPPGGWTHVHPCAGGVRRSAGPRYSAHSLFQVGRIGVSRQSDRPVR